MKYTFKCINQVYELAPPTYVLKILIDPLPLSYLSPYVKFPRITYIFVSLPFVVFSLSLYTISPPLSSLTIKVQNVDRLRLSMSINGVRTIFPNLVQPRTFAKDIQLGLIQVQASSHLQIRVILYHVELNTYSLFSISNTKFASPQTCHMLPQDHFKHTNNSGTIQTSKSFDFHE